MVMKEKGQVTSKYYQKANFFGLGEKLFLRRMFLRELKNGDRDISFPSG